MSFKLTEEEKAAFCFTFVHGLSMKAFHETLMRAHAVPWHDVNRETHALKTPDLLIRACIAWEKRTGRKVGTAPCAGCRARSTCSIVAARTEAP